MEVTVKLSKSASRQEIVQIIGLSNFLRERQTLLTLKSRHGLSNPKEARELQLVEKALRPIDNGSRELPEENSIHNTVAGTRFRQMIRRGAELTGADIVQLQTMADFPYSVWNKTDAHRGAYLSSLRHLGLASEEEVTESFRYRPVPATANA